MNKICTDIRQSKKLIELGIDTDTSDMCYKCLGEDPYDLIVRPYSEWKEEYKVLLRSGDAKVYPAWSLTALLELMPPYLFEFERGIDLNIYRNLNGKGWHCSYMPNVIENMKKDKFRQLTNGNNPVDAAFEMVCWLLENNKL